MYWPYNPVAAEVKRSLDFLAASPTRLDIVFLFPREVLLANSPIITNNVLLVPPWLKNCQIQMQSNQAKSLVGASEGFNREIEKKCSVYKKKDLSIRSRDFRSLLVRLGEEQNYQLPDSKYF